MTPFYFKAVLPVLLGVLSLSMLSLGLAVVVMKRPIVLAARWFLLFVMLSFVPNAVLPFFGGGSVGTSGTVLRWSGPAILLVVAAFLAWSMRGYVLIGVTQSSARSALLATLDDLGHRYEETLGAIRVSALEMDILVAVQSWTGSGQIKAKGKHVATMRQVSRGMNSYFKHNRVSVNLVSPLLYVVLGVMMAVMVVAIIVAT